MMRAEIHDCHRQADGYIHQISYVMVADMPGYWPDVQASIGKQVLTMYRTDMELSVGDEEADE